MIEDIYLFLAGFVTVNERLSRGLLSSKIGSSLCSAKLPEFQTSESDHFAMVAVTRCRRSVFYLVFRSSLFLRFHMLAFL